MNETHWKELIMNDTKWTLTQFVDEWIAGDDTLTCGLLEDAYKIIDQHYKDDGVDYCCNLMADQVYADLTAYDKTGLISDILDKFVDVKAIASVFIDHALKTHDLDSPFYF